MKSISAIFCFIFFSLLLFINLKSDARKDTGDYWKNMMENQPMPEAIKDLLGQGSPSSIVSEAEKKDRFVRDFDIRTNAIIYHSHDVSKKTKKKPSFKNPGLTV